MSTELLNQLITETSDLTQYFKNYKASLDQAITDSQTRADNLVSNVVNELSAAATRVDVYVDSIEGDNNNPGTISNPVKDIVRAFGFTSDKYVTRIHLAAGQEHYLNKDYDNTSFGIKGPVDINVHSFNGKYSGNVWRSDLGLGESNHETIYHQDYNPTKLIIKMRYNADFWNNEFPTPESVTEHYNDLDASTKPNLTLLPRIDGASGYYELPRIVHFYNIHVEVEDIENSGLHPWIIDNQQMESSIFWSYRSSLAFLSFIGCAIDSNTSSILKTSAGVGLGSLYFTHSLVMLNTPVDNGYTTLKNWGDFKTEKGFYFISNSYSANMNYSLAGIVKFLDKNTGEILSKNDDKVVSRIAREPEFTTDKSGSTAITCRNIHTTDTVYSLDRITDGHTQWDSIINQ